VAPVAILRSVITGSFSVSLRPGNSRDVEAPALEKFHHQIENLPRPLSPAE
jgi:hypothetical protein